MGISKGPLAGMFAVAALLTVGVVIVYAAHENGVATNGACDRIWWSTAEDRVAVTATSASMAQVVLSRTANIPCDGTQMAHFAGVVDADPGATLYTYVRATCQSGGCIGRAAPFTQMQIGAPGNMSSTTAALGVPFLSEPAGSLAGPQAHAQIAFFGAQPQGAGQIAAGSWLFEVLAYVSAGSATFDERGLSIESWAQIGGAPAPTPTPTPTPAPAASPKPVPGATATPSPAPSATPASTPAGTPAPTPSLRPSPSPLPTMTPKPAPR